MTITREEDGSLLVGEVDELHAQLFRLIAPSADPDGNSDVTDRLYPTPTGGKDPDMDEEWRDLMNNDLQQLFRSAQDVVQQDVAKLAGDEESGLLELRIPAAHFEQWMSALNQARLAIAARHQFSEREMEHGPKPDDPLWFAHVQMHVYGLLLELLVRHVADE